MFLISEVLGTQNLGLVSLGLLPLPFLYHVPFFLVANWRCFSGPRSSASVGMGWDLWAITPKGPHGSWLCSQRFVEHTHSASQPRRVMKSAYSTLPKKQFTSNVRPGPTRVNPAERFSESFQKATKLREPFLGVRAFVSSLSHMEPETQILNGLLGATLWHFLIFSLKGVCLFSTLAHSCFPQELQPSYGRGFMEILFWKPVRSTYGHQPWDAH